MKYVKTYTYKDISAVQEDDTLKTVIRTMVRHRVSAVPVVDKMGNYVGCISEQDILNAGVPSYMKLMRSTSFMADLNRVLKHLKEKLNYFAKDFIDPDYPTIKAENTVSYAAELMYRNRRIVLPVLDGKRFIGLITRIDILSVALKKDTKEGKKTC